MMLSHASVTTSLVMSCLGRLPNKQAIIRTFPSLGCFQLNSAFIRASNTPSVSVLCNKYLPLSTSTRQIGDMGFTVTIVRHGQTDFNLKHLIHTSSEGTLNETGRLESASLGKFLADEKFTKVYSSDLQRCQDTAKGVLGNLKNAAPAIVLDSRLRERDYAEWDGRPLKDIFIMAKEQQIDPRDVTAPGGETFEEASDRELFESRDVTDEEENVIIFSHGLTIQFLMSYFDSNQDLYELENFTFDRWVFAGNTSRTKFVINKGGSGADGRRKLTFICQYDQSHLSGDNLELLNVNKLR